MTMKEKMVIKIERAKRDASVAAKNAVDKTMEFLEQYKGCDITISIVRGNIKVLAGAENKLVASFGDLPELNTPEERGAYNATFALAAEKVFENASIFFSGTGARVAEISAPRLSPAEVGKFMGAGLAEEAIRTLEQMLFDSDVDELEIRLWFWKFQIFSKKGEKLADIKTAPLDGVKESEIKDCYVAFKATIVETFAKEGITFSDVGDGLEAKVVRKELFS